jgi:TusA-related sulfurtransferase
VGPPGALYGAGMDDSTTSREFLERLAARDFDGLAATLAAGVRARMLLPRGLEEHQGREAIAGRMRGWFAPASAFEVRATTDEPVGARRRLSWRLGVVREAGAPEVVEQVAFVDVGPDGIERLDLVCSGFQAEAEQLFDAGDMGCGDGLAGAFRRRIAGVPVGGSLRVVVSDPAAKEDLPSLARLLGHRVAATEQRDDGRHTITVERRT